MVAIGGGGMNRNDQHGVSLSAFMAVVMFALLLVAGLVIDGGAQAAAARRAETAAAAAARAAADETATARLAGQTPNSAAAIAAAQRLLAELNSAAAGSRSPTVTGEVRLRGGRVVVTTRAETETVFLSLIGIHRLRATGSAEAELVANR